MTSAWWHEAYCLETKTSLYYGPDKAAADAARRTAANPARVALLLRWPPPGKRPPRASLGAQVPTPPRPLAPSAASVDFEPAEAVA